VLVFAVPRKRGRAEQQHVGAKRRNRPVTSERTPGHEINIAPHSGTDLDLAERRRSAG
jgi:hypothetical protein